MHGDEESRAGIATDCAGMEQVYMIELDRLVDAAI
jgi:hypothetical protein